MVKFSSKRNSLLNDLDHPPSITLSCASYDMTYIYVNRSINSHLVENSP